MTFHTRIEPLEDLRNRLPKHKIVEVARVSGVHRNTVRGIRNGVNLNPTHAIISKIRDALDSMEGIEHD